MHLFDFNPHVFSVYPLVTRWRGREETVEVRVSNPLKEPMRVSFRAPKGTAVRLQPAEGELLVPAGSARAYPIKISLSAAPGKTRHVIPMEITARGVYYGEACVFLMDTP
jgi:hypothetical protein